MALPTLSILDNFNRAAESPLSDGGKWTKLQGVVATGEIKTTSQDWKAKSSFATGEDGAYWNVLEYNSPALAYTLTNTLMGLGERYYTIWVCVTNPTTAEISGYRVKFIEPPEGGTTGEKCKILVERCTKNVFTTILTLENQSWSLTSKFGVQVVSGKVIVWKEGLVSGWAVVGEVADSTYTKGFVGFGGKGNIGHIDNVEAGESVHIHTLTASQAQSPKVNKAISRGAFTTTQPQAAVMTYNRPHTQTRTQTQAAAMSKSVGRSLSTTQPQAATYVKVVGRVFTVIQASSYGPQIPESPVTEVLEAVIGFNEGATWTILAWAEGIGEGRELNKGLTLKPHPKGWGEASDKKGGARYNVLSVTDPVNFMAIRNAPAAERYGAIGICVPSNGERSGYVARVEGVGSTFKLTLERWINGVKTVLAETTLPEGYFGVATTGKASPFAITLVGHVLRVWLSPAAATAPTVLLEASDPTFTSGYNTMEVLGENVMLAQMHVASMDGQVKLAGTFSKGQALSTSQGQAAVLSHPAISRTLAVAQPQTPSFARAITRALTAAQGQAASRLAALARTLTGTQPQAIVRGTTVLRSLQVAQAQSIARRTEIARLLLANASQLASRQTAISKGLSVAQPQSPAVSARLDTRRTLTASQPQAAIRTATVARILSAAQAQAVTRVTSPSRTLSAGASALASLARALARTLRVSQGQTISEEGLLEPSSHDHPHTLEASQSQSPSLNRTVGRRLLTSGQSTPTLARVLARTLRGSTTPLAVIRRDLARSLTATSSQSATLGRAQLLVHSLTTAQPTTPALSKSIARILLASQTQSLTLVGETVQLVLVAGELISMRTSWRLTSTGSSRSIAASSIPNILDSSIEPSELASEQTVPHLESSAD